MQGLRNAHLITRFVLVWFALYLGAAMASPLIKPQATELICSSAGVMKLLVKADDGSTEAASPMLDCPLCATSSAPPPAPRLSTNPEQPLAHVMQSIPAARMAALVGAPPPARGPPFFS